MTPTSSSQNPFSLLTSLTSLFGTSPSQANAHGANGAGTDQAGRRAAATPPYPAPDGFKWIKATNPVYEWQDVEIVKKIEVPKMVVKKVQVGSNQVTEQVPVYTRVTFDAGYWETRTVTKYRSEKVITGYTYRTQKVHDPHGNWISLQVKVPKYATRSVPYSATERHWVPRLEERRILTGYKQVPKESPVFEWREVEEGTTTLEVPKIQKQRVQVGTKEEWKLVSERSVSQEPET